MKKRQTKYIIFMRTFIVLSFCLIAGVILQGIFKADMTIVLCTLITTLSVLPITYGIIKNINEKNIADKYIEDEKV